MHATFASAPPLLLAAGIDWLEGLLPVLFVLIWIVSQVWAVFRRVAGPQRPAGGLGPRGARPAPQVARPAGPGRGELERQIAEFLRESRGPAAPRPGEAATGRGERTPATRPQPAPAAGQRATRRVERPPTAGPRRAAAPTGGTAGAGAGGAGTADRAGTSRRRDAVVPNDGGDIARHVTEAFASDLKHRIAPAAAAPALPAALPMSVEPQGPIVDLLRDPESLRRLVIIREVLDRPVERW